MNTDREQSRSRPPGHVVATRSRRARVMLKSLGVLWDFARKTWPLFLVVSLDPPHFPMTVLGAFRRHDPNNLALRPNFVDRPEFRRDLALYYDMIENLDWNIGRLMTALQVIPRFADPNTLLAYFSDHGDFMGSHGVSKKKAHPHEESARIPAIFRLPQTIPARGRVDGLFSLVDLMATTLSLAGVPVPSWNQGTDFAPALSGQDFDGPEDVLLEMVGCPRVTLNYMDWRGHVSARWKYAYYESGRQLLFDLNEDPYEMRNLADEEPGACAPHRAKLFELLAADARALFRRADRTRQGPRRARDERVRQRLRCVWAGRMQALPAERVGGCRHLNLVVNLVDTAAGGARQGVFERRSLASNGFWGKTVNRGRLRVGTAGEGEAPAEP